MRETRKVHRDTSQRDIAQPRKAADAKTLTPAVEDLSFDGLLQDDLVRLVMASDHVSEKEMQNLREVRPLIG